MYYDEFDPWHNELEREVYEDDLQELSDREAFEDEIAERGHHYPESDEFEFDNEGGEDDFLESAYEDRTEIEHMGYFGDE
jgi:hypothetical protein